MSEATFGQTPFGWPVVIYLTLAGIAAGVSLWSTWTLLRGEDGRGVERRASSVKGLGAAVLAISLGGLALVMDLEAPERFWLILAHFNPSSIIAWGARGIALFAILAAFSWWALRSSGLSGKEASLGGGMKLVVAALAFLAIFVGLYPGWVLFQASARPLWGSPWIAPLFLASAIHAGWAIMVMLDRSGRSGWKNAIGIQGETLLVGAQAALFFAWFLTIPAGYEGARERMISGDLAPWLWGGVVAFGWLIPVTSTLLGGENRSSVIARACAILVGALALRTLIVWGGQGPVALISTGTDRQVAEPQVVASMVDMTTDGKAEGSLVILDLSARTRGQGG